MRCTCYRCGALDQQLDAKFCHICGQLVQPICGDEETIGMSPLSKVVDFIYAVAVKTGVQSPVITNMTDFTRFTMAIAAKTGVSLPADEPDFARFLLELGKKTGVLPQGIFLHRRFSQLELGRKIGVLPPTDSFTISKIEIFESADHFLQPTFGTCFYHDQVRYISFKLHFTRISNAKTNATLHWEVFSDNKKYITQQQALTLYPAASQSSSVCFGWGNTQPGSWSAGTYTVRARIETSNTIEAEFTLV